MTSGEITTLLIIQPGNLVYHLVLMLAFALLFSNARVLQSRIEHACARRWAQVSLTSLILHLLLILVGVAGWINWLDSNILLPTMERWVSFTTIALLLWGFLAAESDRREARALWVLLILAGIGAVGTIISYALQARTIPFNSTSLDAAWSVVSLALAATGLLVLLMRRPSIWNLSFAGISLLAIGYGVHMAMGPREFSSAPFVRWGELTGIPILVLAAMRSILSQVSIGGFPYKSVDAESESETVEPINENDIAHLPQVLLDLQAFMAVDRLDELAAMAVRTFARAMKAELCVLFTPPQETGQISIAAGYDLISEQYLEGRAISTEDIPILMQAMERMQTVDLTAQSQAPDLKALKKNLFLAHTGAVLFTPILDDGELIGAIALLSPFARSRWPKTSQRALEKLAALFAERLRMLQNQSIEEAIPDRYYSPEIDATRREVERLVLENTRLTEQLIQATDQASHDLAGFLENHTLATETIQILEDEISRMRSAISESEQHSPHGQVVELTSQLQDTLQELAGARARLVQIEEKTPRPEPQPPSRSAVRAIANLAQDLRQPMSSILGYAELLQRESSGLLTIDQREYIEHIHQSTEKLTRHLNTLINMMAIHTGTLDLVPTSINIQAALRDALAQSSTAIRNRRQTLRVDVPQPMPRVLGDADAIFQMLVHLINNATSATPEGGKIWIAAKVAEADSLGFLTLWITDGGVGISAEDRKRVFNVEYPRGGEPIHGIGEEGIGLSIAKSLIEAMGGRIWVDSQLGQGSTFTILLPLSEQPAAKPTA